MRIIRPTLILSFLSISLLAFSVPPELVGIYAGTSKEKKMDNATGKMITDGTYDVSIEIKADDTMSFSHPEYGGAIIDGFPIINGKNFLFGFVYGNTSFVTIRGKFAGKGKKVKAKLAWKFENNYFEGQVSAVKQ